MKIVFLVSVLVAGSQAFDCNICHGPSALNQSLCEFNQTLISVGDTLLHVHNGHHESAHDLAQYIRNVTNITFCNITNLTREFERHPSVHILTKINASLNAYHMIQDEIMRWLEQNTPFLTKRGAAVDTNLASSFRPALNTLKHVMSGLGTSLKNDFEMRLLKSEPLRTALRPFLNALAQHGTSLVNTIPGSVDALKGAVGYILNEALKQSVPSVNAITHHLDTALSSLLSQMITVPAH